MDGTVPSHKKYVDGTVPSSKKYLDGTVPSSKKLVDGTVSVVNIIEMLQYQSNILSKYTLSRPLEERSVVGNPKCQKSFGPWPFYLQIVSFEEKNQQYKCLDAIVFSLKFNLFPISLRFCLEIFFKFSFGLVWFDFDVYQFNLLLHISGTGQQV